jgi:hypothetical protein
LTQNQAPKGVPVRFRPEAPRTRITPYQDVPKPAILIEDAGFLLCCVVPSKTATYHQFGGSVVGTKKIPSKIGTIMPLADTFVQQLKHSGNATGDKHSDAQSSYLLLKEAAHI